jgi:hypothetical protein
MGLAMETKRDRHLRMRARKGRGANGIKDADDALLARVSGEGVIAEMKIDQVDHAGSLRLRHMVRQVNSYRL